MMETDASEIAIAATLSRAGHPVVFFSRTLMPTEHKQALVKKEADAITEAVRRWSHTTCQDEGLLSSLTNKLSIICSTLKEWEKLKTKSEDGGCYKYGID